MYQYPICDDNSESHCKYKSKQKSNAWKVPVVESYPYLARPYSISAILQVQKKEMHIPCWSSRLMSGCLPRALIPLWNLKSAKIFTLVTATTAVSKRIVMAPLRVPALSRSSEWNLNRKTRFLTSENLSGWFGSVFCAGTYNVCVFCCVLVGLQLLAMVEIYDMPSSITFTMV